MLGNLFGVDDKVLAILAANILSNCAYGIIVPFLPIELLEHNVSLDWIGFIFCSFSLAIFTWAPCVGVLI